MKKNDVIIDDVDAIDPSCQRDTAGSERLAMQAFNPSNLNKLVIAALVRQFRDIFSGSTFRERMDRGRLVSCFASAVADKRWNPLGWAFADVSGFQLQCYVGGKT